MAKKRASSLTRLDAGRVIGVGNLQAGGAGKTPLVGLLARQAALRGLRVCILSRGYGGRWSRSSTGGLIPPRSVLTPGADSGPHALPFHPPSHLNAEIRTECSGDEPALLAELAQAAWIGVGADRAASYERCCAEAGGPFDWVLIDDAFQNFSVHQDVRVLALTSRNSREILFRDFSSASAGADLLVWTKGDVKPLSFGRPLVRVRFELRWLMGAPDPKTPLRLVTAVGDGPSVRRTLENESYQVVGHVLRKDHARFSGASVAAWMEQSRREGSRLAMTGKDWVKWREALAETPEAARGDGTELPAVFEPEPRLAEGQPLWDRVLWGI